MVVPYRERTSGQSGGSAGYLCFREGDGGKSLLGALFIVNELGEPIDFCYSRIDVPASFLWRAGEARRTASRSLTIALFNAAPGSLDVIVSTPGDVPATVLTEDLEIDVPVCHLALERGGNEDDLVHTTWLNGQPADDTPARQVLQSLFARKLALEPFSRAEQALHEVATTSA